MKRITLITLCLVLIVGLSAFAVAKKEIKEDIMTIPQGEDGTICWSYITDTKWHWVDEEAGTWAMDSSKVIGSGMFWLPPGSSEEVKAHHLYLMERNAELGYFGSSGPMSMDGLLNKRMCWNCGGAGGGISYYGEWDFGIWRCLICQGNTCTVRCKNTDDIQCPPPC